jgi:transportin-1
MQLLSQTVPLDSLKFMLQKFMEKSESPNSKIRVLALSSINCFIVAKTGALFPHFSEALIVALSRRASDQVADVRKLVCQAFVLLVEAAPEELVRHLNDIINFMLSATKDMESHVALEACEFWIAFAEHELLQESLASFLPK